MSLCVIVSEPANLVGRSYLGTLTIAGYLMIFLGTLFWVPFLYLKLIIGQPVDMMNYLPYHLNHPYVPAAGGLSRIC